MKLLEGLNRICVKTLCILKSDKHMIVIFFPMVFCIFQMFYYIDFKRKKEQITLNFSKGKTFKETVPFTYQIGRAFISYSDIKERSEMCTLIHS